MSVSPFTFTQTRATITSYYAKLIDATTLIVLRSLLYPQTGEYCIACAANFYANGQRCLSCGLESEERAELVALLCAFAALFIGMAVCVATQSPSALSRSVSMLLMVQHAAVVGKLAAQQVPDSLTWLAEAFSVISLLSFDIEFVKPGCVVGALSFLSVYWCTYGLAALSSLMFVIASLVRAKPWQRSDGPAPARSQELELTAPGEVFTPSNKTFAVSGGSLGEIGAPRRQQQQWRSRFRARLIHSQLILCSVLYLRLSILTLTALQCKTVQLDSDGSLESVLSIDLSTRCYEGAHLATVVLLVWPTLFLFCLGFPLLSAWLLFRSFHRTAHRQLASTAQQSQLSVDKSVMRGSVRSTPLQTDCSVNDQWLGSSSGITSPVAVSTPASPLGSARSQSGRSWPTRPLLTTIVSSRTNLRIRPSQSSAATTPRSAPPAAPGLSAAAIRRPLTPAAFASWSPSESQAEPSQYRMLYSPTAAASPNSSALARDSQTKAVRTSVVELSPLKRMLRQLGADSVRQEQYGYLFRQLKGECYYFRLLFLCTSFGFASASVLPASPTLRLFLTGFCFLADQLIVLLFTPFQRPSRNLLSAGLSLVGVAQCLVMLGLVQLGLSDGTSGQLSLGHSTDGQSATTHPSDALTGVSHVAAEYELVLGMAWLASIVVLAAVHRRSIRRSASTALIAFKEWWRPRPALRAVAAERSEPKSDSCQHVDCSATSPMELELTQLKGAALAEKFSSSPAPRAPVLQSASQSAAVAPTAAQLSAVAQGSGKSLGSVAAHAGASLSAEIFGLQNREAIADDSDADVDSSGTGLLSSLISPLTAAPPAAPTSSVLSSEPETAAGPSALLLRQRTLPPLCIPCPTTHSTPAVCILTPRFSARQAADAAPSSGLPGTVEVS